MINPTVQDAVTAHLNARSSVDWNIYRQCILVSKESGMNADRLDFAAIGAGLDRKHIIRIVIGTSNCVGERLGGDELWSKDLLAVELHELLEVLLMDFLVQ